jgi:hypothetical protein
VVSAHDAPLLIDTGDVSQPGDELLAKIGVDGYTLRYGSILKSAASMHWC